MEAITSAFLRSLQATDSFPTWSVVRGKWLNNVPLVNFPYSITGRQDVKRQDGQTTPKQYPPRNLRPKICVWTESLSVYYVYLKLKKVPSLYFQLVQCNQTCCEPSSYASSYSCIMTIKSITKIGVRTEKRDGRTDNAKIVSPHPKSSAGDKKHRHVWHHQKQDCTLY